MTEAEQQRVAPGDSVVLNSGGPWMTVVEITTPGRDKDNSDAVVWWRAADGTPQIAEFDLRCVKLVARGGGLPL